MVSLPGSVSALLDAGSNSPAEDVVLAILRDELPDVECYTLVPPVAPTPSILVRKVPGPGVLGGDPRFNDEATVQVDVFADDPDGDEKGALIGEAVRLVMFNAGRDNRQVPGMGSVVRVYLAEEVHRASDWADASGPVQYAELPLGVSRYQVVFTVLIRRWPVSKPVPPKPFPGRLFLDIDGVPAFQPGNIIPLDEDGVPYGVWGGG